MTKSIKKLKIFALAIIAFAITTDALCQNTNAPKPVYPIPSKQQLAWQQLEQYAMITFGMNTFNNMEWGYGDTPLSYFNPIGGEIHTEQWVEVCKKAGLKGLLIVAKHHDGFCLWPSKYTDYSVKNTPWKNGKGDIVDDLYKACKKHGLKFALYLSPWDRHHADYGNKAYITYFHNQIRELMERYPDAFEYWFDGANGGDGYYGGARENRKIKDLQLYYNYPQAVKMIKGFAPEIIIFGGTCNDIRWIGNESGFAGETNWAMMPGLDSGSSKKVQSTEGDEFGPIWRPGEADVSIRPGWFYHEAEDNKVKSISKLVDIYYNSVGRNANLLLGLCPDKRGKIHKIDSVRLIEWWRTIQNELKNDILHKAKVTASNVRSKEFSAKNTNDNNQCTYWATEDGITTADLTFTFNKAQKLNRILLQEYIELGQRVADFDIEYMTEDGSYKTISTDEKTSTIGYKRILRFNTINTKSIRIKFLRSRGPLCISNVQAFLAPSIMTEPDIIRNEKDMVVITAGDKACEIYYTVDGSEPTLQSNKYVSEFPFRQKGQIKAISYDKNYKTQSTVSVRDFDIPLSSFSVIGRQSQKMFDGQVQTAEYFENPNVIIDMGKEHRLKGITYLPIQDKWSKGFIHSYEIYAGIDKDNLQKVASGEFSNIKHSPTLRTVKFPVIQARYIRIYVSQTVDDVRKFNIGEFSVITD